MAPLIGREYIGSLMLVKTIPNFLREISQSIRPFRPIGRIIKDIDITQPYMIISMDHTKMTLLYVPDSSSINQPTTTISIEIKPKWAFLPSSSYISESNSIKRETCRFCMHKHLKNSKKQKKLKKLTDYCPLDLFSLEKTRLIKSLNELIITPGNNFKVFKDGRELNLEENNWLMELHEFFSSNPENLEFSDITNTQSRTREGLIRLLTQTIIQEQILFSRLKNLQKTLDELDIEGIIKLLSFSNLGTISEFLQKEPELDDWKNTVENYLKRFNSHLDDDISHNSGIIALSTLPSLQQNNAISEIDIPQRIYEFLLSTTIKDCSIMFTFQKSLGKDSKFFPKLKDDHKLFKENIKHVTITPSSLTTDSSKTFEEMTIPDSFHQDFHYKINVLDLDPKSIAKITYYHELDTQIVQTYLNYIGQGINGKKCYE
ncbi:hypothetical protein G9A89_011354 [Geosiphon pyriformis]|nr:hypothetical protein G9A89_011354 [Geosiphon pyriformis]